MLLLYSHSQLTNKFLCLVAAAGCIVPAVRFATQQIGMQSHLQPNFLLHSLHIPLPRGLRDFTNTLQQHEEGA